METTVVQYENYDSLTGLSTLHSPASSDSAPAVVALHGWLDNARSFDCLAREASCRHWLALDLPGHGRSSWSASASDYSVWGYATRVARYILSLNRPVDLVCHSMGATTGLVLAATGLLPIRSLSCIDGLGPLVDAGQEFSQQFRRSLTQQLVSQHSINSRDFAIKRFESVEEAVTLRKKFSHGLTIDELTPMIRRSLIQRHGGYAWSTDPRLRLPSMVRLSESHVEAYCRDIDLPVMLISATDSILPKSLIEQRLAYFSRSDHQVVSGGHHLHLSQATAGLVSQALKNFWGSI